MTYLSQELAGADPIELYEFTFGTTTWRFTAGDADYIHPTTHDTYLAEPIQRGNLIQSDEDSSMSLEVTVDAKCPIADFFRTAYLPGRQMWLTIYRTHQGDAFVAPIFRGAVGGVTFTNVNAKLQCVPMRHAIGRQLPTKLCQRLCSNTLYDLRCKADPASFTVSRTITGITGLTFTLSSASGRGDGYFSGGYIEGINKPPATIRDDTANVLTMMYNTGYVAGDVINLIAGCDRKISTCANKFGNQAHFQGFPFMPNLDPFADEIA